jgi:hypothetical protein
MSRLPCEWLQVLQAADMQCRSSPARNPEPYNPQSSNRHDFCSRLLSEWSKQHVQKYNTLLASVVPRCKHGHFIHALLALRLPGG